MNGTSIRVLLIEDQLPDAILLEETLTLTAPGRFIVTRTDRLALALELLRRQPFDVILSDLGLPDSQGADTFVRLRQQARHLPIIVLTGLNDEEMAVATVQAGAQDYLVKGRVPGDLLVRALQYAIERTRIEEELRQRNEQMASDLAMASEFQQAFLPRKFPTFPQNVVAAQSALRFYHTYRPSGSVGGDFFTVRPITDTRAGLFLCDVMGHGVRAALVTAMMRGLIEDHWPAANEPDRFLAELNHSLVDVLQQTDATMFVTACYAIADATTQTLTWSRAGHPSPFLIQRATGTVQHLPDTSAAPGPVLGLFPQASFPTGTLTAQHGDILLLFTDGLYEVAGPAGDEFGLDRLQETVHTHAGLPPQQLLDKLIETVQVFGNQKDFADDVCLLAVEFNGKV